MLWTWLTLIKHQLDDFLDHPPHQDTMAMNLPLLMLFGIAIDCPSPNSLGVRRFTVKMVAPIVMVMFKGMWMLRRMC